MVSRWALYVLLNQYEVREINAAADFYYYCKESIGAAHETQRNAVCRSARQPHAGTVKFFPFHLSSLFSSIAFLPSDYFPSFQTLDNDDRPSRSALAFAWTCCPRRQLHIRSFPFHLIFPPYPGRPLQSRSLYPIYTMFRGYLRQRHSGVICSQGRY